MVQIKGERLYKAARRGEVVERQSRPVTIHSFELRRDEGNKRDVHFRVACSKGTYIRSLAHDLVSRLPTIVSKTILLLHISYLLVSTPVGVWAMNFGCACIQQFCCSVCVPVQ